MRNTEDTPNPEEDALKRLSFRRKQAAAFKLRERRLRQIQEILEQSTEYSDREDLRKTLEDRLRELYHLPDLEIIFTLAG